MIAMMLLLLPPLLASCAALVLRRSGRLVRACSLASAALTLGAGLVLCARLAAGRPPLVSGVWRVDALSALLAACIAFVALLASAIGPGVTGEDPAAAARTRRFHVYLNAFAFTMLAAVTTDNLALMWVAIEATTIVSAMVIPLTPTKASVEASWKYILICSVGIALAFAGTVLAYFDFVSTAGHVPNALTWGVLRAAAPSLHAELLQLAFAFILVGYGTKAGIAPMHTWLPDAHSEAPSAVSALMSGVLLAVAMYAIARWKAVVDAAVDPVFTSRMLVGFGLASLAVGTFSLVIQRHYKRMLAYSSVEHMGLVAVGLGLGPLGAFAAWLHIVNHAVAKSMSFLLAGRVLHRYGTPEIARVSGLLKVMPVTGSLFAAGILALTGVPPFGLFVSEFLLVRAAVLSRHPWLAAAILLFLLTAFISLLTHLNRMLYGDAPADVHAGERRSWTLALLMVPAAALVVLGVVLPAPLGALIHQSVAALMP